MVLTSTGKPGKMEVFCNKGKVREFWTQWKSKGILDNF